MLAAHRMMLAALVGGTTTPPGGTPPPVTTGTYEAENAALVGPAVGTLGSGYVGAGYVGNWGLTGQYVEFTVSVSKAASYRVDTRYRAANGGAGATRDLSVDGGTATSVSFADNNAAWDGTTWSVATPIVTIPSAGTHKIRFTHPGPDNESWLDLDSIALVETSSAPPPVVTPPPTGGPGGYTILGTRASGTAGHLVSATSAGIQSGANAYNIVYQMTGVAGTLVNATGAIFVPTGTAPSSGRPVIACCHGATGLGDAYAPGLGGWQNIADLINAGYVVVTVDGEGLGSAGRHPYAVASSGTRSVCDAIRACSGITTVRNQAAVFGFSIGGLTALQTAEYAAAYASELNVVAVGFDPVVLGEYPHDRWTYDDYVNGMIYGHYAANTALPLTTFYGSTLASSIASGAHDSDGFPTGFGTQPSQDPTTAGSGWSTAFLTSSPGYRKGNPSLVIDFGTFNGPVPWLSRALAQGTAAERRVRTGSHDIGSAIAYHPEALSWVASKLAQTPASTAPPPPPPTPSAGAIEAESATVVGPTVSTENPGYQGAGYVGNWGLAGQYVEFAVNITAAKSFRIDARYRAANGGAGATRDLTVDGGSLQNVVFPDNTPAWTDNTWSTAQATVTLGVGTHLLRFTHPGPDNSGWVDLDNILLTETTAPPPPPPPPPSGTTAPRTFAMSRYPSSGSTLYVDLSSGSDAAAGATGTPKRTIGNALAALGGGGTVIVRGNGVIADTIDGGGNNHALSGRVGTATNYVRIIADVGHTPKFYATNDNTCLFIGNVSRYVMVWGFEIQGQLRSSPDTNETSVAVHGTVDATGATGGTHHITLGGCYIHDFGSSGPSTDYGCNYIDYIYNRITRCAVYSKFNTSGLNMFCMGSNGGTANGSDGASGHVIGNQVWNCYCVTPFTSEAGGDDVHISDGNAIIGDYNNQSRGYSSNGKYPGTTLVAFNVVSDIGGAGLHPFNSDNFKMVFNTAIETGRTPDLYNNGVSSWYSLTGGANADGNTARYNIIACRPGQTVWINPMEEPAGTIRGQIGYNVVLNGTTPSLGSTDVDRRSVGVNGYFSNPGTAPTTNQTTPSRTNQLATDWKPKNSTNTVRFSPDGTSLNGVTVRTALAAWPCLDGVMRPSSGDWAAGALEPVA